MVSVYPSLLSAGNFSFYSIGKGIYYDQTAGGTPVMKSPYPYLFNAQIVPVSNRVAWANVKLPVGSYQIPLFGPDFSSWDRGTSQAAIDSRYPNGSYVFDVFFWAGGDQLVTNSIVAGSYPNAPTVANVVDAQTVDATSDFTLTWNAFTGGTATDFISVQLQAVLSNVFATPAAGIPGALNGTATSVIIPAGTLLPGRAYLGRLTFATTQGTFTNEQSGASGATFMFSQTDFWLRTQGTGDNTPPTIAWTTVTNGATGVPPNTPIGAYFSKPMGPHYSVFEWGYGASSGGGGYYTSFSPDGLEVVQTPVNTYGANMVLTFIFNPFDHLPEFGDLNGNPLAAESFVLSFTYGATFMTPRRPFLKNPQWQTNGTVLIELQGEPDYFYTLECSTNSTTWFPLMTNVAFSGTAHFVDTNAAPPANAVLYRGVAH